MEDATFDADTPLPAFPPLTRDPLPYPKGMYIETFDEFKDLLCTEEGTYQFIFEKTDPGRGIPRLSRGIDAIITAVPFGKPVSHTHAPLSDSPNKRFFIDVPTQHNKVFLTKLREQIDNLEKYPTKPRKELFNYLRWHVDMTTQSLTWTITHIYNPLKNNLQFNSPTNGFRVYLIQ